MEMNIKSPKRTAQTIAFENDLFRKRTPGIAGSIYFTEGVNEFLASMGDQVKYREEILQVVGNFSAFARDNDPYGEHDFGRFDWNGNSFFFKIDYGHPVSGHYQDPYEMVPYRILTIMFVEEY